MSQDNDNATAPVQRGPRPRPSLRARSESYGAEWCARHCNAIGPPLAAWMADPNAVAGLQAIPVHIFDGVTRTVNTEGTLHDLVTAMSTPPTHMLPDQRTGQVQVSATTHVSAAIYQLVCAVYLGLEAAQGAA